MEPKPMFDTRLYAGAADYYERFRPPYPRVVLDFLRARVPLGSNSEVIDLACGTGQLAFGLAPDVAKVWAIDQEPEFVDLGQRKSVDLGISNIRWTAAAAADVPLGGVFDLVVVANAFHRLDRSTVTQRLVPHISERGCVALLWSWSPWNGDHRWQQVLNASVERWIDELGARGRIAAGWEQAIEREPHHEVLQRAGLDFEGRFEFEVIEKWTVETLIGNLYSTSVLNPGVVGNRSAEFEQDITSRLLESEPDGTFTQQQTYAIDLARLGS